MSGGGVSGLSGLDDSRSNASCIIGFRLTRFLGVEFTGG